MLSLDVKYIKRKIQHLRYFQKYGIKRNYTSNNYSIWLNFMIHMVNYGIWYIERTRRKCEVYQMALIKFRSRSMASFHSEVHTVCFIRAAVIFWYHKPLKFSQNLISTALIPALKFSSHSNLYKGEDTLTPSVYYRNISTVPYVMHLPLFSCDLISTCS